MTKKFDRKYQNFDYEISFKEKNNKKFDL